MEVLPLLFLGEIQLFCLFGMFLFDPRDGVTTYDKEVCKSVDPLF